MGRLVGPVRDANFAGGLKSLTQVAMSPKFSIAGLRPAREGRTENEREAWGGRGGSAIIRMGGVLSVGEAVKSKR